MIRIFFVLPVTPLRRVPAIVVAVVALSLGAFASGCGGGSSKSSASSAQPESLSIKSFAFAPSPLAAKTGDTITVTNNDDTNHQVVADDKSFDTGAFSTGSKTFTVSKAGTVTYHCEIHNYMTGVIQVAGT